MESFGKKILMRVSKNRKNFKTKVFLYLINKTNVSNTQSKILKMDPEWNMNQENFEIDASKNCAGVKSCFHLWEAIPFGTQLLWCLEGNKDKKVQVSLHLAPKWSPVQFCKIIQYQTFSWHTWRISMDHGCLKACMQRILKLVNSQLFQECKNY